MHSLRKAIARLEGNQYHGGRWKLGRSVLDSFFLLVFTALLKFFFFLIADLVTGSEGRLPIIHLFAVSRS